MTPDPWPTCTECGADVERIDVMRFGDAKPVASRPGRQCCVPPPTPAEFRARVDAEWLAWQRRLATEEP